MVCKVDIVFHRYVVTYAPAKGNKNILVEHRLEEGKLKIS